MPFAPRRIYDENGLTPKQAAFVRAYLVSLNAKQAATEAGYSAHTATEKGHALLHTPKIAAVIAKGKAERAEKTGITAEWVLKEAVRLYERCMVEDAFNAPGAVAALTLVGKHVGVQAFKERLEHTGPNGAALVPVLNVTIGRAEPEPSS